MTYYKIEMFHPNLNFSETEKDYSTAIKEAQNLAKYCPGRVTITQIEEKTIKEYMNGAEIR